MTTRNRFALMSSRAKKDARPAKRRALDDYETPEQHTETLLKYSHGGLDFRTHGGRVLEPCAGTGRMAGVLERSGFDVTATDIKQGHDFLKRSARWPGHIFTNPPYRDGLADAMMQHALKIADGCVAMLMQQDHLWGSDRARELFHRVKPCMLILIPERIYFIVNGKPIESQFFNHQWIIWPQRTWRARPDDYACQTVWARAPDSPAKQIARELDVNGRLKRLLKQTGVS